MGLMSGIAGGILRQMPIVDARNQRDIENERADIKQKMWLAQQQRQQDEYERKIKERAANRLLFENPTKYRGLMELEGPMQPENQEWLQTVQSGASPETLFKMSQFKSADDLLREKRNEYLFEKRVDSLYREPKKPGTDPYSVFVRMYHREPTQEELFTMAQGLKGKSGQNMSFYTDENGNLVFNMGDGANIAGKGLPAPLTPGAKTTMQKEHQGQVGLTDSLDYIIGNLQPKYFDRWEQTKMEAKKFAEKTPILNRALDQEDKDEIADYNTAKAGMGKTLVEMVRAASGKQVTDKEREFIKNTFAISEDDSYESAVGKVVNLYNMLAIADARYRAISALNGGAPPTQDQIYAWQYSTDPAKREALLRAYGYKEVTKEDIRKKMGANVKKKLTADDIAKKHNL